MSINKSVADSLEDAFTTHDEDEKFELALGRLMIAWADAEKEAYHVLMAYAGVTNPVARALFSGTRIKEVIDFIKAIDFNSPLPIDRSTDLAHVFAQIGIINGIRNHLVHYSSQSYSYKDREHRVVVNQRPSRYGNTTGYEVSSEIIDQITQDLYAIANHLNMHHGPRTGPFTPWRENSPSDPPTPWLYKQLQAIDKWETIPDGARTSPLQPKSAPEKSRPQKGSQ